MAASPLNETPVPPSPTIRPSTSVIDPPPPYPSQERRPRGTRNTRRYGYRIQTSDHRQAPSADSYSEYDSPSSARAIMSLPDDGEPEPNETTPFLMPFAGRHHTGRPRSISHFSVSSVAPSLAQTIRSLFQTEEDSVDSDDTDERPLLSPGEQQAYYEPIQDGEHSRCKPRFLTQRAWARYFRPLKQKVYYKALVHLLFINFPYALAAWVYLFVFTLVGTTLLMALPLGAFLCFLNLLGARIFARGELNLQTRFHHPLAHPTPYPPRPIFVRFREPTVVELETGSASSDNLVRETSFYKNTYAMFTDPTSYQALFYFLVIKPTITLLLSLSLLIFGVPGLLLVLPAPLVLRAVRKLGIWQANVAVEGLYYAVR